MYDENKYTSSAEREARAAVPSGGTLINGFINRVFSWMFAGLAITGGISWYLGNFQIERIIQYRGALWILGILEVVVVIAISAGIRKFSAGVAALLFALFALLNGLTLSWIFVAFNPAVIAKAFCSASLTFGVTGLVGYTTKKDLSTLGSLCGMGLIGLIIASIVNFFWYNSTADFVISCIGVLLFVGLTAWDVQKIKLLALEFTAAGTPAREVKKYAVLGALELYLDFINLFIFLLRILYGGKR